MKPHPNSERRELPVGDEDFWPFVVSRGDGSIMFDFVEKALDEISATTQKSTEGRRIFAVGHQLDVAPCATCIEALPQRVAVVGAVGQEDSRSFGRQFGAIGFLAHLQSSMVTMSEKSSFPQPARFVSKALTPDTQRSGTVTRDAASNCGPGECLRQMATILPLYRIERDA